jgi:hypothetical protein
LQKIGNSLRATTRASTRSSFVAAKVQVFSSEGASLVTTAPVLWQQGAFFL